MVGFSFTSFSDLTFYFYVCGYKNTVNRETASFHSRDEHITVLRYDKTMALITKTTIESNAYTNIYNVLNNRSNIDDPRNSGNTSNTIRRFIYDYDPFHMSVNFRQFPYIILFLPELTYSATSTNGKLKNFEWRHRIIVRTASEGSQDQITDRGRTDMLNISDDINETFNKESVKQSLRALNIYKIEFNKIRYSTLVVDNKPVYESEYQLLYMLRLTVSD